MQLCATLQALRWRLTRVNRSTRRSVLTAYIHFDILSPQIFSKQFESESLDVKTTLMSLVNNMVSDY